MNELKRPRRRKRPYDPRVSKRIGIAVVASLPVAVLLGVVIIKLVFMMLFAQLSIGYAASGDYKAALSVARWNLIGNVVDPWRAYYNTGTAELGLELYDDSRNSLSYALQTAPLPESCMVRTNLALAIEGQGDIANEIDEFEQAALYYDQAVAMLDNMPDECASESPSDSDSSDSESEDESDSDSSDDPADSDESDVSEEQEESPSTLGEQGEQSKERLEEKSEQATSDQEQKEKEEQEAAAAEAGEGAEGEEPAEETEAPGNTPIDDLGDRMDEAEQDRSDWDSVDRSQNAPFQIPDKPW